MHLPSWLAATKATCEDSCAGFFDSYVGLGAAQSGAEASPQSLQFCRTQGSGRRDQKLQQRREQRGGDAPGAAVSTFTPPHVKKGFLAGLGKGIFRSVDYRGKHRCRVADTIERHQGIAVEGTNAFHNLVSRAIEALVATSGKDASELAVSDMIEISSRLPSPNCKIITLHVGNPTVAPVPSGADDYHDESYWCAVSPSLRVLVASTAILPGTEIQVSVPSIIRAYFSTMAEPVVFAADTHERDGDDSEEGTDWVAPRSVFQRPVDRRRKRRREGEQDLLHALGDVASGEMAWYQHEVAPRVERSVGKDSRNTYKVTEAVLLHEWPLSEPYYYGIGGRHRVDFSKQESDKNQQAPGKTELPGPTVDPPMPLLPYPLNLLKVRPCAELGGKDMEVVARSFIPCGTCFPYNGEVTRGLENDEIYTFALTSARQGRKRQVSPEAAESFRGGSEAAAPPNGSGECNYDIRGKSVARYINHYYNFAPKGNVEFSSFHVGVVSPEPNRPEVAPRTAVVGRECHFVFFIALRDIYPGEKILADSYGPEYDAQLEREVMTHGHLLSYNDAAALSVQHKRTDIVRPAYEGNYRRVITAGSIVARRGASNAIINHYRYTLYVVRRVYEGHNIVELEAMVLASNHGVAGGAMGSNPTGKRRSCSRSAADQGNGDTSGGECSTKSEFYIPMSTFIAGVDSRSTAGVGSKSSAFGAFGVSLCASTIDDVALLHRGHDYFWVTPSTPTGSGGTHDNDLLELVTPTILDVPTFVRDFCPAPAPVTTIGPLRDKLAADYPSKMQKLIQADCGGGQQQAEERQQWLGTHWLALLALGRNPAAALTQINAASAASRAAPLLQAQMESHAGRSMSRSRTPAMCSAMPSPAPVPPAALEIPQAASLQPGNSASADFDGWESHPRRGGSTDAVQPQQSGTTNNMRRGVRQQRTRVL